MWFLYHAHLCLIRVFSAVEGLLALREHLWREQEGLPPPAPPPPPVSAWPSTGLPGNWALRLPLKSYVCRWRGAFRCSPTSICSTHKRHHHHPSPRLPFTRHLSHPGLLLLRNLHIAPLYLRRPRLREGLWLLLHIRRK